MKKADYSRIAASYDKGCPLSEQNIELWLKLISKYSKDRKSCRVFDLGCGTGRFALPIASQLHYRMVGADSSKKMLARAQEKDIKRLVEWDYQDAQNLTYNDESFDIVFMSHLLHHVSSPARVLRECQRVLVTSGVIIIRYGAIEQIRHDVEHVFFPEVLTIDEARTPTFGNYKGFGLGVLVDILCGVLSGSSACILKTPGVRSINHFFGALRIDSFLPVENFKKSMDEMITAFEALPTLPGFKHVYVAGGYEAEVENDRRANGIPLNSKVIEKLQELAEEVGIECGL